MEQGSLKNGKSDWTTAELVVANLISRDLYGANIDQVGTITRHRFLNLARKCISVADAERAKK